jgi:hypothetical protein
MPIIRKKLVASAVYPDDIRYNADTDTVQSFVNGSWVDNPDADPRRQTTFPPRLTSDPACDAAKSVLDAIKGQIDSILTAIDNAQTAFSIAALVLGLFTFGVFDIFIAIALGIANAMLDAGTSTLSAALTDPVYQTWMCIIFCQFGTDGRLKAGGLDAIISQTTDMIGGIAAVTLNAFVALAGEGGINNLASLGTATGDCSECPGGETCPAASQDWEFGTVTSLTEACGITTITVNSQAVSGTNSVRWGTYSDASTGGCFCISFGPSTGFCDDWYYRINGEPDNTQHGPVSNADFSIAIAADCMNLLQVNCGVPFTLVAKFQNCP